MVNFWEKQRLWYDCVGDTHYCTSLQKLARRKRTLKRSYKMIKWGWQKWQRAVTLNFVIGGINCWEWQWQWWWRELHHQKDYLAIRKGGRFKNLIPSQQIVLARNQRKCALRGLKVNPPNCYSCDTADCSLSCTWVHVGSTIHVTIFQYHHI